MPYVDVFRRTLAFLVGMLIVVAALVDECPRVAAVTIGLLLMGVFTVPEAISFVKGTIKGDD